MSKISLIIIIFISVFPSYSYGYCYSNSVLGLMESGDINKPTSRKNRIYVASNLKNEALKIMNDIPNLSAAEEKWLNEEYKEREVSAINSVEWAKLSYKGYLINLVEQLNIIINTNTEIRKEMHAWGEVIRFLLTDNKERINKLLKNNTLDITAVPLRT